MTDAPTADRTQEKTGDKKNLAEALAAHGNGEATVAFEHRFFTSVEDSRFQKSEQTGEPVFALRVGENDLLLPFPGIKREFALGEDSADALMLDAVARALDYVKVLRIGDPLPREILTGEASWEVTPAHRQIAFQRLTMQLVTWLSGDEVAIVSADELMQVAEDPKTKERVNAAFSEAARHLGLGPDGKEQVVRRVEALAEEFAYIEALREQYRNVAMMDEKICGLQKLYAREQGILEIVHSVARLMRIATEEFDGLFEQVDAQTGEIVAALKNIDAQTRFVKALRDDLYCRLLAWGEMFEAWKSVSAIRSPTVEDLLRRTYRFLAPRYMKADEWVLMNKLLERQDKPKTEMVW